MSLTPRGQTLDVGPILEQFATHGYARLGKVLTEEAAVAMGRRADAFMRGDSARAGLFYQPEPVSGRYEDLQFGAGWQGPSARYRKLEHLELDPLFAAWIENQLFRRLAHAHLGEVITLYRSVLWNKAAAGGMAVPWHQDDGRFWGLDRTPSLQVWTALDPAGTEAGCLEVMPGSHHQGLASAEGGTVLQASLDAANAEQNKVRLPCERGECILVHNHLWHRTGCNGTDAPRKAVSISFLAGDTRCTRRRRAPRTFRRVFHEPLK